MTGASDRDAPTASASLRQAVSRRLLPWFDQHRRDLPWRRRRTPYRVWIAELMLHQTRVEQAIPYFNRFVRRFPSLRALASASVDEVLLQWEGLGYYARARHALATARYVADTRGGRFPRTYAELHTLPGVGPYTAAAIASLAFNQDHAVVDGNVIRVLSRLVAYPHDARTAKAKVIFQTLASALLVRGEAARFNESLMELGALICTPRNPDCAACPLHAVCIAYREGDAMAYPVTRPRKKVPHKIVGAGVIVNRRGQVLIAQRKATSMLGGLWEFPGGGLEEGETMPACIARELKEELGIETRVGDSLMIVRHAYSHFTIALHVHWARIVRGRPRPIHCADYRWVAPADLRAFPFSRADLHVVEKLQTDAARNGRAALPVFDHSL